MLQAKVTCDERVAAAVICWRHAGALWMTLVAKVTLGFGDGAVAELRRPAALLASDRHFAGGAPPGAQPRGAGEASSVEAPAELAPLLPRPELTLVGHAYAPSQSSSWLARVAVLRGPMVLLDKRVLVTAAEQLPSGARTPLRFELAYGGPDVDDNPLGTRDPLLVAPSGARVPACFAPIPRSWPVRRRAFDGLEAGLTAEPLDLGSFADWDAFHAAPPDQRLPALAGGDRLFLEGIVQATPRLDTFLPPLRVVARAARSRPSAGEWHLDLTPDQLHVDADTGALSWVFRARMRAAEDDAWSFVVGLETQGGQPIPSLDAARAYFTARSTAPGGELGEARASPPPSSPWARPASAPQPGLVSPRAEPEEEPAEDEERADFAALAGPPTEEEVAATLRHNRASPEQLARILAVFRRESQG